MPKRRHTGRSIEANIMPSGVSRICKEYHILSYLECNVYSFQSLHSLIQICANATDTI